jgi:parvulin-like peptidyl-prolyl isomerase
MKKATAIFAATLCFTAGVALRAEPVLVNGYAAIVNDRVITYYQVEDQVPLNEREALKSRFRLQPRALADEMNRLRQDALNGLIESELILHEFETAGYKLSESIVDQQVRDRIREEYGSRVKAIQSLQAKNTTLENFRKRVREDFIISQMTYKNVFSPIIISPHKIEVYYKENQDRFKLKDRVHLRMITIPNKAGRDAKATREVADDAHTKLQNGTPFKDVALQASEDSYRAQGGDWDWVERGALGENLEQVIFSLKPGQLSDVVQRDDGCYLMFVDQYQPAHVRPLSEVRDEIEETLRRRERGRLREEWVKRLREKSLVQLFFTPH